MISDNRTAAIFDLDSTLVDVDTYPAFLWRVLRSRPGRWLRAVWLPAAFSIHTVGSRDNTWLKEEFLRTICSGSYIRELEPIVSLFVSDLIRSHLRPGGLEKMKFHQDADHRVMLATASPDIYVLHLAEQLGISEIICTRAERDPQGRLTGRLDGANCHGVEKLKRVKEAFGSERKDCTIVAYSDHESDFELLEWADVGIAVHPTASLRKQAIAAKIQVVDWN